MKFQLTEQLKEHMTSKNLGSIALEIKMRSCWSGSYAEVSAKFADQPKDGVFETYEADGFPIYVQQGVVAEKEIVTLGIEKMLFLERITIEGLKRF